jgi:hypothetical protein
MATSGRTNRAPQAPPRLNVGQHPLDPNAVVGEPGLGPLHEPGRGLAGLIGVDLGIGQPGMVIDRGMDEPHARPRPVQPALLAQPVQHCQGSTIAHSWSGTRSSTRVAMDGSQPYPAERGERAS